MDPLVATPITATVALTEVGWGTKVDLVCAYADASTAQSYQYSLVVTGTDGGNPGDRLLDRGPRPRRPAQRGHVLDPEQIRSVEIKTTSGLTS